MLWCKEWKIMGEYNTIFHFPGANIAANYYMNVAMDWHEERKITVGIWYKVPL